MDTAEGAAGHCRGCGHGKTRAVCGQRPSPTSTLVSSPAPSGKLLVVLTPESREEGPSRVCGEGVAAILGLSLCSQTAQALWAFPLFSWIERKAAL